MVARTPDYAAVVQAPCGHLGIVVAADALSRIDLLRYGRRAYITESLLVREICRQLDTYFVNAHHTFHLPLALDGTPFQHRVWHALRQIPPGHVRRYAELARELGTGARAIGGACRRNPIPIVVPCHRVVASAGLGGYMGEQSGAALRMKQWLVSHERSG